MATDRDYKRAWALESTLNFTRYMFRNKAGRKFVIGPHHRVISDAIDRILACDPEYQYTIFNIAPRYGKTELVVKSFISEGLAINPKSRFLHISYSEDLVLDNSKDILSMVKSEYYRELFPEVYVQDRGAKKWYTSEGGGLYAVSSAGQVTGFGAGQVDEMEEDVEDSEIDEFIAKTRPGKFSGAIIIDDPLKPEDALSDVQRERVNARFENTIRSRVNSRHTPIVVIMQRLHERDLCGYLMGIEPDKWKVISLPCIYVDEAGNERALWPFKDTLEELKHRQEIDPYVFDTQYMQNPTPIQGLMYTTFRTYSVLPIGHYVIKNYTDTADTGSDFLCSLDYAEFDNGDCYILDTIYTDKPMEYTEPETARMLTKDAVVEANIESNNGGRSFARAVERNVRELGNRKTTIQWFTQTANKEVRIFGHSAEVQNCIFWPEGWERKWPLLHAALTGHRKEGHNAHDDAPDAVTGIIEKKGSQIRNKWSKT